MWTSERRLLGRMATLVLACAVALLAFGVPRRERPLSVDVALAGGTLHVSNSRAGGAILAAPSMRPGDSAQASLTLTNDGGLPAIVQLDRSTVSQRSGTGGGRLADQLQWHVTDFSGATVPFAAGGVTLGTLEAGSSRVVTLHAALPRVSGNDIQGAQAKIDLTWSVTAAAGTEAVRAGSVPGALPQASLLTGRFRWRVTRRGAVVLAAGGCSVVRCHLRAWGWIAIGRKRAAWGMRGGQADAPIERLGVVRMRTSVRGLRVLGRAGPARRHVRAIVFVRVSTPGGRSWLVKRRIPASRRVLSRAAAIARTQVR